MPTLTQPIFVGWVGAAWRRRPAAHRRPSPVAGEFFRRLAAAVYLPALGCRNGAPWVCAWLPQWGLDLAHKGPKRTRCLACERVDVQWHCRSQCFASNSVGLSARCPCHGTSIARLGILSARAACAMALAQPDPICLSVCATCAMARPVALPWLAQLCAGVGF